jgi:hypothetical protein
MRRHCFHCRFLTPTRTPGQNAFIGNVFSCRRTNVCSYANARGRLDFAFLVKGSLDRLQGQPAAWHREPLFAYEPRLVSRHENRNRYKFSAILCSPFLHWKFSRRQIHDRRFVAGHRLFASFGSNGKSPQSCVIPGPSDPIGIPCKTGQNIAELPLIEGHRFAYETADDQNDIPRQVTRHGLRAVGSFFGLCG